MAAASYVSDLTEIADCEPAGTDVFGEPTGATMGVPANDDTDNFIQGARSATKTTGSSGAPALAGLGILDGAPHTINSPNAFYCWVFVGGGGLIDSYANGGIRLIIGSSSANFYQWYVDGNNYFPYIGWQCIAVETDNAVVGPDATTGTPTGTKQYFGAIWNCLINIGKGNPMAVDALRWGRTITITAGDLANGYATFGGCAGVNDQNANRWGQFQAVAGGYQLQGRLLLGQTSGTAVDFRDSNVSIVTAISRKVAASFNAIEVQNTGSRVDWDSVTWAALGTVSRGTFTVTDDCDVNITNCSFTGLSTFTLKPLTSVLDTVFRQCDAVTCPGADMRGSQVLVSRAAADTGALIWTAANTVDTDGKLDDMTFSRGANAHHAIQFGTTTKQTITLRGVSFSGFNVSDGQNDSVLFFPDTGGNVTWTVNAIGCQGTISYKKARSGDTVNIVQNPVTLAVHVIDADTLEDLEGARVLVLVDSAAGGWPYKEQVTITSTGTTATVAHTGHGLSTNDHVYIEGANEAVYNGVHQITVTGVDSYTYVMTGDPDSPATGTITATMAVISGLTDANGNITASRTYDADQPITGRVRFIKAV